MKIDIDNSESEFNQTFTQCHKLYQKYQFKVHNDGESDCDEQHFKRFLCAPPFPEEESDFGGFHHHYYIDGKLVAVGVLDILPWCISSVYFFYDPDYESLSLGTLSALFEIKLTQDLHEMYPGIEWYYMGYYIHSCPKMRYKGKFKPSFLLCPKAYSWWPIEECAPKLDLQSYCTFDPTSTTSNAPSEEDMDNCKVLFQKKLCSFAVLKAIAPGEEVQEYRDILVSFISLIGLQNAHKMCVYY